MPKVSILIPVFNRETFVADCIQSALSQTFTDFEVIVVDNASTDRSWEVAKAFASLDPRVRVFRNDSNLGPVRNWQRCLDNATGEFVKFLFSDDLILPEFLAVTLPIFDEGDIAFVSTAAFVGESLQRGIVHYLDTMRPEILPVDSYLSKLADGDPKIPVSPGTAVFRLADARRNVLINVPTTTPHDFSQNGAGTDVLLFALTATRYKSVSLVNKPLVFFRVHSGSITIGTRNDTLIEGYRLALAWFLKYHSSAADWGHLVARVWISRSTSDFKLENPFKLCQRYSGNGSWSDVGRLFFEAIKLVTTRVLSTRKFWAIVNK